ncbi:hypothetical protein COOONC_08969 [Cooperia oncophora]
MEINNGTHNMLKTACCSFSGMSHSRLIRTIFLGHDDRYEGGIVQTPDHTSAFDLIKEDAVYCYGSQDRM